MIRNIAIIFVQSLTCFFANCQEDRSAKLDIKKMTAEELVLLEQIDPKLLTDHIKIAKLTSRKINGGIVTLSEVIKVCGNPYKTKSDESGNFKIMYLSKDSSGQLYRTNFILSETTIIKKIGFDRPSKAYNKQN